MKEHNGNRDEHGSSKEPSANSKFPIVGVGASAGGLEAFTQLLTHLPADSGMAFVLIQHLDPTHPSFLRDALAKATEMTVVEPQHGMAVQPNHVYVIPPDTDLTLRGDALQVVPRAPNSRRPHLSIDLFLRSLATERGSRAIGVVLTGSASDGMEGLRAIKEQNGITMAQDPDSAKFGEMPRNAVNAGVVDYVLGIPALAQELVLLSQHPYVAQTAAPLSIGDQATVNEILSIVRKVTGADFTEYKGPTLERRLARRMALRRTESFLDYLVLIKKEPGEAAALYEDMLIHVTSFFRDREVFEALASQIFPAILKDKPADVPVRIWVAGCSTGEEVYSLAICLMEILGDSSRAIQIFGSDLSEAAIAKARAGTYAEASLRDVSDERRRRYFIKTERGYRITKAVRDVCVFVQHDLTRDPPFSRLDLVSCRNVLIYFDQGLQKRIIPTFHYALNQPGYLLLGRTESISGFSQLFSVVDKVNKVFTRTGVASTLRFAPRFDARQFAPQPVLGEPAPAPGNIAKHLDRMLLARYAPPGVLITDKMRILQFRGQTGAFLQPAPGEPQNDLIKMARPGLLSALRATIEQVKQERAPVTRERVEVDHDGVTRLCNLVVFPFTGLPEIKETLFVVLFEECAAPVAEGPLPNAVPRVTPAPREEDRRIPRVEHELLATKEYLQSVIEEHGRTNDDLGSANEELISGNEELQSLNEELETAKEELQSTNEELTTVNDELQRRNQEITQVNGDLLNLLITVDIPIIIVDRERRIRRFTPKARNILNVLPTDRGRLFTDLRPNIDVADLDQQIAEVIETMTTKESEVRDRQGRWHRMQIRPYKNSDNTSDGAILSLVDIDALKHHVSEAQKARAEAERANFAKDLFLAILGHELRTPLSSLLLRGQMLRRGGELPAAKMIKVGEAIERATRMQIQLVDDLLDVSRIVAGKLKVVRKAVALPTLVRAALEAVCDSANKKSISLEVAIDEDMPPVSGDALRLQQVVTNLLTNAIKFTPEKGRVALVLETAAGDARITVTDNGAGIDPGFLPNVFNRFSQQDSTNTRTSGGLGLGLAIVRHLVEEHGGTVQATSPGIGRGATFAVTLPLMKVQQDPASTGSIFVSGGLKEVKDARGTDQFRGLRVLVVDDDLATRETVAELLRDLGAKVEVAESAAIAMSVVEAFKPRVLLCDIAMPGEDGYNFIRKLRARGGNSGGDTPALALTALATEDDHQRALTAGFQMHLTKPVDIEHLSDALLELAQRPGAAAEPGL